MNERIEETLGRNIRAERRNLGLSKVEFCLQVGISRVLLDLIEENRSNFKLATLEQIAAALGKEPWELLK
ncbi:MAG: helix-turn-helix transcriptional regulator [Coriobacteriaceae bacterium]|nr:helix-turn-helix transcriptional regulator [Coriobacteriaceae bacterium]